MLCRPKRRTTGSDQNGAPQGHLRLTARHSADNSASVCAELTSPTMRSLTKTVPDTFSALTPFPLAGRDKSIFAHEQYTELKTVWMAITLSATEDGEFALVEEPVPDMPYNSRQFMEHAIEALFLDLPGKKDSMARRVKNAVRLIGESDNQRHNSIGLALSVTAIEALICRKGDNLAQMFAENMAFLLEPDPAHRLEAERWGKRIYDLRSGVLHGSDLDCSARDISQAKLAASMVLRAALERRAAIKRVGGNDENPDEFLNELRSGKYRPGQLTHVSELPLKRFWRSDSSKRSA